MNDAVAKALRDLREAGIDAQISIIYTEGFMTPAIVLVNVSIDEIHSEQKTGDCNSTKNAVQ